MALAARFEQPSSARISETSYLCVLSQILQYQIRLASNFTRRSIDNSELTVLRQIDTVFVSSI